MWLTLGVQKAKVVGEGGKEPVTGSGLEQKRYESVRKFPPTEDQQPVQSKIGFATESNSYSAWKSYFCPTPCKGWVRQRQMVEMCWNTHRLLQSTLARRLSKRPVAQRGWTLDCRQARRASARHLSGAAASVSRKQARQPLHSTHCFFGQLVGFLPPQIGLDQPCRETENQSGRATAASTQGQLLLHCVCCQWKCVGKTPGVRGRSFSHR